MLQNFPDLLSELKYREIILLSIFATIWLLRLSFELFLFVTVILSKKKKVEKKPPRPFSIIIAIRNEEDNLREKLPLLLNTEYPDFEVVVVDDFSQDNSLTTLGLLKKKYKNLRISSLNQETRYSSKLARNIGIKAAQKDWILTMEPSFEKPADSWLESFSNSICDESNLIIGYSNIVKQNGLFNLLFRIELFLQQLNSFTYIKMGAGYVLKEDNIAFKKQKYFDVGGFAGEMNEDYANMELLINKFLKKRSTSFAFTPEANIRNAQAIKGRDYKELLIKSWRIKRKLKLWKRLILMFDDSLRILFLPVIVSLFIVLPELIIAISLLVALWLIVHILIVANALIRLDEQKIFISSLIYEIFTPYIKMGLKWFNHRSP